MLAALCSVFLCPSNLDCVFVNLFDHGAHENYKLTSASRSWHGLSVSQVIFAIVLLFSSVLTCHAPTFPQAVLLQRLMLTAHHRNYRNRESWSRMTNFVEFETSMKPSQVPYNDRNMTWEYFGAIVTVKIFINSWAFKNILGYSPCLQFMLV